ncbi:MAG: STAS domain-containing protein [Pseudomonadota bacterium]|nr:STAS domain-containing protein [Pseudomonadota bacterium]
MNVSPEQVNIEKIGDVTIVNLIGPLDAAATPRVRKTIESMPEEALRFIVVDMAGVSFIDSTGVSVLVSLCKQARGQMGDLVLCSVRGQPKSLLEMLRFDQLVEQCADRPAATAFFEDKV